MSTLSEIIALVNQLDSDEEIRLVNQALNARAREIRAARSRVNAASLKVGDRVTIGNVKPKYLAGLTGTVTRVVGGAKSVFEVRTDEGYRRGAGQVMGFPASCLTKIETPEREEAIAINA